MLKVFRKILFNEVDIIRNSFVISQITLLNIKFHNNDVFLNQCARFNIFKIHFQKETNYSLLLTKKIEKRINKTLNAKPSSMGKL